MKAFMYILYFILFIYKAQSEYIPPGPLYNCPKSAEAIKLLHPCVCESGSDAGLYIFCENVGIATLSVGLRNLATFDMPLEQLILKELKIGRLYGSLLHRLKVRILKILDTPITKIEEDVFYGVNNTIQDIYLINTQLDTFPKAAFKILGNLTILHIDKHNLKEIEKDVFSDSLSVGKLERLHIINGDLAELHIESFQPLRKLKTFDVHGNKLTSLKRNQFKGLRDVEVLDLSYNNITKLESSHIADLTKLSWCNISHNHLSELSRGMFARNAVLRVLHMDNNKLKRLDTNSFRGMRFLRRLYLSDNEISDVGRGTFGSVTRIGTIDLARNKIKKVDFQMFFQLNFVEIIDLAENQITEIQKQSFKDIYLAKINISHNAISKIEAGSFENCANITILDLSYNNLTQIPSKAFDATTYATELQLSYNELTALNQVPLHNMTGLKTLNVSHNMITNIPKNTFPKLYELHTVDVSYNQLTDIASAVFQSLFSLRYLNLSHNTLEQIKPPTFGTLPTLLSIDLSHNFLKDISKGALTKLASCRSMTVSNNMLQKIFQMPISLGVLDLSYNNITEVPENTWPSMNALLKLDLSYNSLKDGLSTESFRNLLTLQTLVLTNTGLTRPPWEALSALSSLQYLKLNKNYITELNKGAFGRLPIVFDLDLTDNQIVNVSPRAFDGLLQLLALSLQNNNITHIPNEAFKGLVSLRSLDLSQNQIEKLDNRTNGLLDDCLSLERVNLSHNKISFITRKMFPSDPYIPYNLKVIDLSYNEMPVITGDLMFGTKKLEVLNISNNILNDIRKGIIGNLTSLRHLDLSHNSLNDLTSDKDKFLLPPKIQIIDLSHNDLLKLPVDHIINAVNITEFDVSNNSLEFFDDKLVPKIKNSGLRVHFSGNPFRCDCFARPLKHYINHLPKRSVFDDDLYSSLICTAPINLKDSNFVSVGDDRLNCIENVGIRSKLDNKTNSDDHSVSKYDKEPDLVFREIHFSQNSILIKWYVQSANDIADFSVIVRNERNEIFYSEMLPYFQRELSISIKEHANLQKALKDKVPKMELCILAGNSVSSTFNYFQTQCKMFPEDFDKLDKDIVKKSKIYESYNKLRNKLRSSAIRCKTDSLFMYPMMAVLAYKYIFALG